MLDSLQHFAQTHPVWGGCPASHTDAMNSTNPPFGTFVGLWVGRREPYNLTLENKTYYTQNDDSMR